MKVKITEPGWEGFTGLMGYTHFVDGVSVEDVGTGQVQAIAACVRCESVDANGDATGTNPSAAQVLIDTTTLSAPVEAMRQNEGTTETVQAPAEPAKAYTDTELAEIADKGGIKAIRAISDPLGLKGTSIAELIGKILASQEEAAAKARAAEEAAAVEKALAEKAAAEAAAAAAAGTGE